MSPDPPFGTSVVVWRTRAGAREVLLLHRAHRGPDYEGDWAWTPPSGCRLPGEEPDDCAVRELAEETGLSLDLQSTDAGSREWWVYTAEAPGDAEVRLDAEHDAFRWVAADDAAERCQPDTVSAGVAAVVAALRQDAA